MVRCVKDEKIGSITATLTPSVKSLVPDTQISLAYKAHSYGSVIEHISIVAIYTTTSGEVVEREIRTIENCGEYVVDGNISYITPSDCNDSGVLFHLIVRNEHGLVYTEEVTLVKTNIEATFNRWEDTMDADITNNSRNFVIVGEEIRYYVNVSADADPSSVTINGEQATRSGSFSGSQVSNTTWYITLSKATKGVYDMTVDVTVNDKQKSIECEPLVVYGLNVGARTTSIDTSGNMLYMLQNAAYTSTYLTSTNTTVSANTSQNYYNLFTIEGAAIRSVSRGTYFRGTNGNILFNASPTNYTITTSGNNIQIYTRSGNSWWQQTYYLRQTSNTAVSASTNTSNRNWNLLPVTYDMP